MMDQARDDRIGGPSDSYKWVALSNTTLGMLAATVNSSILLISLPAVFRGIGLRALDPGNINYLLWAIIGYMIATAVLVVSFGRLGDQHGRARMYSLGFAIFTVAALALGLLPGRGRLSPRPISLPCACCRVSAAR